jgi:hypothetical protein
MIVEARGLFWLWMTPPASLKLLVDFLTSEGYEARPAITGELAVHAAEREPPDPRYWRLSWLHLRTSRR